jgi:hypothetical protein
MIKDEEKQDLKHEKYGSPYYNKPVVAVLLCSSATSDSIADTISRY